MQSPAAFHGTRRNECILVSSGGHPDPDKSGRFVSNPGLLFVEATTVLLVEIYVL